MAEIREELVLEDKFSRVLDDFMKRLENIEKIQDRLAEQNTEQNKHTEDINNKFDRLNNTALRLANNGFAQLQRRLLTLGASFIGMRALYKSFMGSVSDFDSNIRFNNRVGNEGNLTAASRELALKYGGNIADYSQVNNQLSKFANTNESERMRDIGAKLASITPGMSVAQGMGAVGSAMYNRSGSSLINQFGLNANRSERHKIDILLQQGRLSEALDIIEQLSEKAGATEKSLNNMLNSPLIRLQKFQAVLDDVRKTIGDELLNALMPIIDAFDRLLKSEQFKAMVNVLVGTIKVAGSIIGDVINLIIDNFDRIGNAIKKIMPWLTTVLALLGLYKMLMITIPPILIAVKGAIALATTAQMGLNAAMLANPIGLVAAGIIALIAGLTALSGKFDNIHTPLARLAGIVVAIGAVLKNTFAGIYNAVGEPITQMINIFGSLINTFINLDKPLVALQVLFTDVFTAIANIVIGSIQNMIETLASLKGLPILGDVFGKFSEFSMDKLNIAKNWITENKEKNDEWAESQGYRKVLKTDNEFNRMGYTDITDAYGSAADKVAELGSKFGNLTGAVNANTAATIKSSGKMDNLGNIIDKESWMDRFNFATTDMERTAVKQANNTLNSNNTNNYNITINESKEGAQTAKKVLEEKERIEQIAAANQPNFSEVMAGS